MTEISPDDRKQNEKEKALSMDDTGRRLVYFAAERTLLTWIRIALTLMGLGFIIDRFSLVLNQTVMLNQEKWFGISIPSWAGSGMVILGTVVSIVAAVSYGRFTLRYQRTGDTTPGSGLLFGEILCLIVALFGIAIFLLLFTISR
jgi:putative membrane protein